MYDAPEFQCSNLWARPIYGDLLLHPQGPAAAIEELSRPWSDFCSAPRNPSIQQHYPRTLSKLAQMQMAQGETEGARQTLIAFDALWPMPDADLPLVMVVERVRRWLEGREEL